jgi:geranylgeranyl pyrophosphate synthase
MSTQDFLQEYSKTRLLCEATIKKYASTAFYADYPQNDFITKQGKRALLLPGKRLRPALAYSITTLFGKRPLSVIPYVSLELLHTFLLMHDDMIDKSTLRRGKANILGSARETFKQKISSSEIEHFANSVAVVGGDTLVLETLQPVLSSSLPDKVKLLLLDLFRKSLQETCYGWYIQFLLDYTPLSEVKPKAILDSMFWVTGKYTFALPIHFALTVAGKPWVSLRGGVDTLALELGTIFQIGDDIIGLVGDPKKTGKSASSDIEQGKKTLPLYYAYKEAKPVEKKRLESLVGKQGLSAKEISDVRTILDTTGALDKSRREIELSYNRLKDFLSASAHFRGRPALYLLGLAEYMMEREA